MLMKRILAIIALVAVVSAFLLSQNSAGAAPLTAAGGSTDIEVTVSITGFSAANYSVPSGTTVFDLMRDNMPVSYQEFPGLGAMVTCIRTLCQNSTHYWQYYVNGALAPVGAPEYKIDKPMRIEWRLEIPVF